MIHSGNLYRTAVLINNDFIFKVNTTLPGTSASNQFNVLHIGPSGYNYTITTSDGYTATVTSGFNHLITFPSGAGIHTVTISGTFSVLYNNNPGDAGRIIEIVNFGNYGLNSTNQTSFLFRAINCTAFSTIPPKFQNVTTFQNTFRGIGISVLPNMVVSSGTNFRDFIRNSPNLVDCKISSYPSGTTFLDAFNSCTNLTFFPANAFDLSPATNYNGAWFGCNLNQQSVDNILVSINTARIAGVQLTGQTKNVMIVGGTSATPSLVGRIAADQLRASGFTVTLNGY